MKYMVLFLIVVSGLVFSIEKIQKANFRTVMSDIGGMPLDDGTYEVTFRFYDSRINGNFISEETQFVECKDGTCKVFLSRLSELEKQGYTEVWVSVKTDDSPETTFRTRVFLDKHR